tara:strand:- start:1955 stop:2278 length:324 start_codon:yes stop_codon:yes gene_type:complete
MRNMLRQIPEEMLHYHDCRALWASKGLETLVVFDDIDGSFAVHQRNADEWSTWENPFDAAEAAAFCSVGYHNVFDIYRAIFNDPVVENDFRTQGFVEAYRSLTGGEA